MQIWELHSKVSLPETRMRTWSATVYEYSNIQITPSKLLNTTLCKTLNIVKKKLTGYKFWWAEGRAEDRRTSSYKQTQPFKVLGYLSNQERLKEICRLS
jgi:hypothetical protein